MANREYTDFEEMQTETGGPKERDLRTTPWSLDEFVPVFDKLGLVQDGDEYVLVRRIQTGRMVVNGKESIQTKEFRLSFRFDAEFTAELDGSMLAGVWVILTSSGQTLLSDLIYCVPEDIEKYYAVYLNSI